MSNLNTWTTWLQSSLENLYRSLQTSVEDPEFTTRFQRIFSPDALIYVNHELLSVVEFEHRLKNELSVLSSRVSDVEMDWREIYDVPDSQGEGGIAVGLFVVIQSMQFRIRAGPAQIMRNKFFSAKIIKAEDIQPDDKGNHWRVTHFFLTEVDKPAAIHLKS